MTDADPRIEAAARAIRSGIRLAEGYTVEELSVLPPYLPSDVLTVRTVLAAADAVDLVRGELVAALRLAADVLGDMTRRGIISEDPDVPSCYFVESGVVYSIRAALAKAGG